MICPIVFRAFSEQCQGSFIPPASQSANRARWLYGGLLFLTVKN